MRKNLAEIVLQLILHEWGENRERGGHFHLNLQIFGIVLLKQVLDDLRIQLTGPCSEWLNSLGIGVQVFVILDDRRVNQILESFEKVQLHIVVSFDEPLREKVGVLKPVVIQLGLETSDYGVDDLDRSLSNFPRCVIVVVLVIIEIV